MTTPDMIRIKLRSATTFGRGDGVAGLVDREVEHDRHGFPFLRGKTLKGLLKESAENVVYALEGLQGKSGWSAARDRLFGKPGRGTAQRGILHIGNAVLPADLRSEFIAAKLPREDVLYALTAIRRQTAMNPLGGPEYGSLRSMRVLLPDVILEASLTFDADPTPTEVQLLTAAVLDFRRAGTGRNRGRGQLAAELVGGDDMEKRFEDLSKAVLS